MIDTVGAGDAFASVMILGLVKEWPTHSSPCSGRRTLPPAIVGKRGATVSDPAFYQSFTKQWKLGA